MTVCFTLACAALGHQNCLCPSELLVSQDLALVFTRLLNELLALEPKAAGNGKIGEQAKRFDRSLDNGKCAAFQHDLQSRGIFVTDDGKHCRSRIGETFQQAFDFRSRLVFHCKEDDIGAKRQFGRHRPEAIDGAADTAQVIDQKLPFGRPRMDDKNLEIPQISKKGERHRCSLSDLDTMRKSLRQVRAIFAHEGVWRHAQRRIVDDVVAALRVHSCHSRP
ncbi:hypothetical protein D3C78_1163590 [compost metagenome]